MIIFKHSHDLRAYLQKIREKKNHIGFVPTMGALHEGHLSLIKQSKTETGITVCSIYVNPVQFNNPEDFKKYPVSIEADIFLLEQIDCDILFLPGEKEIYPDALSKLKHFDIGYLETILEGKYRPGHFQGVCLVVEKLLNIIEPSHLYLGQKDYQQSLVIKKLVQLMQKDIKIIVSPTLREKNGLAMSSRNLRLDDEEKNVASELFRSLQEINKELGRHDIKFLKDKNKEYLEKKGFEIDYLEIAAANDLTILEEYKNHKSVIILVAAFLSDVRLIDNLIATH